MRGVIESPAVMDAVDEASERWDRFHDAWSVVTWVLSRDPTVGYPLVEGGHLRSFVFEGSMAHQMPTIDVLYAITDENVIIQRVRIRDAAFTSGHA